MNTALVILVVIGVLVVGRFIYSRLSARSTLERLVNNARDEIKTEDDIYRQLLSCIILNGNEYESFEEVEEDLHRRASTLEKLDDSGFGSNIYKNLSDTNKKIYLIVNGYDLSLIPQYLLVKAMDSIGNPSDS